MDMQIRALDYLQVFFDESDDLTEWEKTYLQALVWVTPEARCELEDKFYAFLMEQLSKLNDDLRHVMRMIAKEDGRA